MIELERHIEILLLGNDCVVVPGLGGFVAHHLNARYDIHDRMFLPPLRTIGFNPQLTINDSLLVQSYVEAYDMSYPEALQRIEKEVKKLSTQLNNEGFYELHGIGRLQKNDSGKTEFVPFEAGILTPDFYGLSSFEITSEDQTTEKDNIESLYHAPKAIKKTKFISISSNQETGQKTINMSVSALRNTAVAAIIIAAFFFITSPLNSNRENLSVEKIKSGILYGILNKSHHEKEVVSIPKKVITKNNNQKKIVNTPSSYWSIVLCSHVGLKNATSFTEQLHQEGLSDAAIYNNGSNIKVLYGKYSSKESAYDALRSMKNNPHFKQSWILEVK